MTKERYQKYLQSDFWKKIRARFWAKPNTQKLCFICGEDKNLDLHHLSYRKLKKNTTNNLILLCRTCHFGVHRKNGVRVQAPKKLKTYKKLRDARVLTYPLFPAQKVRFAY